MALALRVVTAMRWAFTHFKALTTSEFDVNAFHITRHSSTILILNTFSIWWFTILCYLFVVVESVMYWTLTLSGIAPFLQSLVKFSGSMSLGYFRMEHLFCLFLLHLPLQFFLLYFLHIPVFNIFYLALYPKIFTFLTHHSTVWAYFTVHHCQIFF